MSYYDLQNAKVVAADMKLAAARRLLSQFSSLEELRRSSYIDHVNSSNLNLEPNLVIAVSAKFLEELWLALK